MYGSSKAEIRKVAPQGEGLIVNDQNHRLLLQQIARRAMLSRGFEPDMPPLALAELNKIQGPALPNGQPIQDLRNLVWCSLDNDDSLDLDQLTIAEALPNSRVKILVAIADVDALVKKGTAIDDHARRNTTSVYTSAIIFPMLPNRLSTDLCSLNFGADRLAVIVEMVFNGYGFLSSTDLYRAMVTNRARLSYDSVAEWLDGRGPKPEAISLVRGLEESLRLQDMLAQKLKTLRQQNGALYLETIQIKPVFAGNVLRDMTLEKENRAKEIIEEFMVAANGVTARHLTVHKVQTLRRVVRVPKRWDRIVELAADWGVTLPQYPDNRALEHFLNSARLADPANFADLSLNVIKLLGSGEYMVERLGGSITGHFGLAEKAYTHSTAPNRRYPDLITQRVLKASLSGQPLAYGEAELKDLAGHCTAAEDAARKVERQVLKSAAAILLQTEIGEQYEAIVTGASEKGTWVRLLERFIEGRLESGFEGLKVGQRLLVQLVRTDVERGFIDFARVKQGGV
jgi:exoribonuclease-2